jgi:excisionase family DNA binding protein
MGDNYPHERIAKLEIYLTKLYLTHEEAADFLRVPTGTLYKWCHQRKIPYFKPSSNNLFKLSDLIAFIEGKRVATALDIEAEAQARYLTLNKKRA